jgi:hypothetical protein
MPIFRRKDCIHTASGIFATEINKRQQNPRKHHKTTFPFPWRRRTSPSRVFDKHQDNCCFHDWFTWRIFVANDTDCPHTHTRIVTCLLYTFLDLTSKQTLLTPLTLTTFTDRRWKSDRWSIFVQVYRSRDMAGVHTWRMFVIMYRLWESCFILGAESWCRKILWTQRKSEH